MTHNNSNHLVVSHFDPIRMVIRFFKGCGQYHIDSSQSNTEMEIVVNRFSIDGGKKRKS